MDVDLNARDLDVQLDKLATLYESGGGYGSPEGELEHQRKFQLLMHRQNLRAKQFISKVTVANVALTAVNIGVLIYQVFFNV